ncbi:hypothetical protein JKF63_01921 [Porcisia hertigi]|uniref:Transmembrane protein n=1 Tax=Porcisia hertigi TaxID=2761500 RepID=A0A836HX36_9TRYP|nr:hypothetical protein JKF63_01921 [Porcisia hertigi]
MHSHRCRRGFALTCVFLIALLVISPSSSLTLTTAQDKPARNSTLGLSEVEHHVELHHSTSTSAGEHVPALGLSAGARQTVEEAEVEAPLRNFADTKHGVWNTQQVDVDADGIAVAEEQRFPGTDRAAEAIRTDKELQMASQADLREKGQQAEAAHLGDAMERAAWDTRVEDKQRGKNAEVSLEAQIISEEAAAQSAVKTQRIDEAGEGRESLLSTARAPVEESGTQGSDIGTLHAVDLSQDSAGHQTEPSPLPHDPAHVEKDAYSTAAATPTTDPPTKEEVRAPMIEEVQRMGEDEVTTGARRADRAPHHEDTRKGPEEETRLANAAGETQEQLAAERREVLVKMDEEVASFQAATSELMAQEQEQEQERMSAVERERAAVGELHVNMRKTLENLEQDVLALGEISVTLHGRVIALSNSKTSLFQAEKDALALGEEVEKVSESLQSIRVAVGSLTDAARAAVASHDDTPYPPFKENTLLADRRRELETAHNAAVGQLLDRLKALDAQLAEAERRSKTEEEVVAEVARTPDDVVAHPPPSVTPSAVGTLREEAPSPPPPSPPPPSPPPPSPSNPPQSVQGITSSLPPSVPLAEPRVHTLEKSEESRVGYRQELIGTLIRWSAEGGHNETSHKFHPHRSGVPFKVRGGVQIIGTAVIIAITTTVQILWWCRGGCRGEDDVEEINKVLVAKHQAAATSPQPTQSTLPRSSRQMPQCSQASPLSKSPPRVANASHVPGDVKSQSHLESDRSALSSQRDGLSTASQNASSHLPGGSTPLPTPVQLNTGVFPPRSLLPQGLEVTRGPPQVTSLLDATRRPPLSCPTPPFTAPSNGVQGLSPSSTQGQRPLTGGRSGNPPLPPLSSHPPTTGAPPQMQRPQNDGDDFELHNPFLSRWS